jgi:hypothetical protein
MHFSCSFRFLTVIGAMCLAGSAVAQTTTPTATNPCPSTTAPNLVSFSVERVLDPAQVLSTLTPTLPEGLSAAIQNKAMELHESIAFNSQNQVLTLNLFSEQAAAPLPTPPNSLTPGSIISILALKVDKVYTTCTPNTSLMFVGTVATNTPAGPFGNVTGAPAAVSVGLTNDNPPKITNVVVLEAGTSVAYSAAGAGTVTFSASTVTQPGSGTGPKIVVKAPDLTTLTAVELDASGTTGDNVPLTFQWTVVAGAADIANPKSAKALGYILGSVGTYTFRVTVTDSKGNVSSKDVNIQYL